MRIAVAVAVALGLASISAADPVLASVKKETNIPAQGLGAALQSLAQERQFQIVYLSDAVDRLQTSGAVGTFTADEALKKLLNGTGLTYKYLADDTITIAPIAATPNTRTGTTSPHPLAGEGKGGGEAQTIAGAQSNSGFWNTFRLAQAESPSLGTGEGGGDGSKSEGNRDSSTTVEEYTPTAGRGVPEVLVSGTRSLNADIRRSRDDIQPYVVINREVIERSGATSVNELLRKTLPANAQGISPNQTASIQGNTSAIDLRGLGQSQTLILVDGRAAGSYAMLGNSNQPDLNSIPLSAIERIEVLPVSASGIYGGKATGGVVNVVLRHDFSGLDSSLNYDNSFRSNSAQTRADFAAGFGGNGGKLSVLLSGSYSDANPLLARDRDFIARGRDTIQINDPNYYLMSPTPPLGRTTNIRSLTGQNLTLKSGQLLNSPIASVPDGYAGAATDNGQAFLQTAGRYNLTYASSAQSDGGGNRYLLSGSIVRALRANVRYDFTPALTAFVELSGSENYSTFGSSSMTAQYVVPSVAPNNPFNQDILITTPGIGTDGLVTSTLKGRKGVAGAILRLPWKNWRMSLDYTFEKTQITSTDNTTGGISFLGSSAISSGAVDVLRDTNAYPVDLQQYAIQGSVVAPVDTTLESVALRVGGSVFRLWGGDVDLSLQLENRRDRLGSFSYLSPGQYELIFPQRSQTVRSAYTELRVPVVSTENSLAGLQLLEFQLAGRFDDYELNTADSKISFGAITFGTDTTATDQFSSFIPTFGVRLAPVSDVMLRASYGKGFAPPALTQLVPSSDLLYPTGNPSVLDPRRGNTPITTPVNVLSGGNPDLDPEESTTRAIGIVLTPRWTPGIRLSFDWVRIDKKDNIGILGFSQNALDNELAVPGLITRAPPQGDGFEVGPVTAVNGRYLNMNRAKIEAYDWSLDYTLPTPSFGTFKFLGSATQNVHNSFQITPVSNSFENVGLSILPRWSATAALTWQWRRMTWGWNTQYLGGYSYTLDRTFQPAYGHAAAPSAVYHDVVVSYQFPKSQGSGIQFLSGTDVSLGIKNVFNTRPRFDLSGLYYDPKADPRGAAYYVTLRHSFL